jgi:hypothetical protein
MTLKYTKKKLLTRPTISMKAEGAECFVKIEGSMFTGKAMKEKIVEGQKPKEPATLLNVINLSTGEEAQLVVPTVMKSVFEEDYADDSYVGKCFHIKNLGKKDTQAGQRYNKLLIEEIEVETDNKVTEHPAKTANAGKK